MESQVVPPGSDMNTGPMQEAVTGLFLSIACVSVSLRFYVRARMVKKLWWDDFFLLLGLLFSIAALGLAVAGINSGFGRHIYYLSPEQIFFALKLEEVVLPFLSIISLMFTKISICLFLLRIIMSNRAWRRAVYVIMALIVATNLSSAIAIFPQCKPIAKLWNPTIQGTCISKGTQLAIYYYQGGVSIFTDFLLAFMPAYFLKDIQIMFRTKLSICALMSLGVLTGICAINRTALSTQIYSSDITYSSKSLNIWAGLEIHVATIAAAIPALRPLWAKSVNQNQQNGRNVRGPNNRQRLNSTYVMMDRQQPETDTLHSRLETSVTAQGRQNQGDVGSEATFLSDRNGILKTSDISMKISKIPMEGNWAPERSSLSDGDRRAEDVV